MTKLPTPRRRLTVAPITVKHMDGVKPVGRVVRPTHFEAPKEAQRRTEREEMLHDQRLYLLRPGDAISITGDQTKVWWFTRTVNVPEKTVAARTLIMDRRKDADLPFARVEVLPLETVDDQSEANFFRRRLGLPTQDIIMSSEQEMRLHYDIPKSVREKCGIEPPRHPHDCECDYCLSARFRDAA